MELLRKYQKEHPEEYEPIRRLKAYSAQVDAERKRRASEKLARIEECRRILYGK